ncbi:MAG TPA: ECF-type sigma factor [Pirellulaceae bacterium]|nr:ECF-type sigma factor [Pirellulaceae bacterium]
MDTSKSIRLASGENLSSAQLLEMVYDELRRLANHQISRERSDLTLTATALVHEAYLRLSGATASQWNGERHFVAAAAEAMRRILVEQARRKRRVKHGGGCARIELSLPDVADLTTDDRIIGIHESIAELAAHDPELAEIIKLRFFLSMTNEEIAVHLDLSVPTIKRRWRFARAWLKRRLSTTDD